jgi:hypothetical protein
MEPSARAGRKGRLAVRILTRLGLVVAAALLVTSRGAKADVEVPPDGKYEHVIVEGRVVPMIHVMERGSVVLVDTDGVLPRTWEEQYKRHGDLPNGTFDIHRTHVPGHATFAEDPIDRKGLWTIDSQGNITAH